MTSSQSDAFLYQNEVELFKLLTYYICAKPKKRKRHWREQGIFFLCEIRKQSFQTRSALHLWYSHPSHHVCQWTNNNLEFLLFLIISRKKNPKISCGRQYICRNVLLSILLKKKKTYVSCKRIFSVQGPRLQNWACKEKTVLELECPLIQS